MTNHQKNTYFKYIMMILERISQGKKVNLRQLGLLAKEGTIPTTTFDSNVISKDVIFTHIAGQYIMAIQLQRLMAQIDFLEMLESIYLPIDGLQKTKIKDECKSFIESGVIPKLPERLGGTIKPKKLKQFIFCYCKDEDGIALMEYHIPHEYQKARGIKPSFDWERRKRQLWKTIPQYFQGGTVVLVGGKTNIT